MKAKPKAKEAAKAPPAAKAVGRSLGEFRNAFDKSTIVPAKIKSALAELGVNWAREVEFAKLAGISIADLGAFRAAFDDHIVILRGEYHGQRVWVGQKATAAKMREMLR